MLEQTINTTWFQFLDQVNNVFSSNVVEWNRKTDLMGKSLYFMRKSGWRNYNNALFVIQILGRCEKRNAGATGFLLHSVQLRLRSCISDLFSSLMSRCDILPKLVFT